MYIWAQTIGTKQERFEQCNEINLIPAFKFTAKYEVRCNSDTTNIYTIDE